MKKEILILLVIVGAFATMQSLNFVRPPDTKSSPWVIRTDDDNFYANMEDAGNWVMLNFWAPWCGPCKRMKPAIHALAEGNSETLRVLSINKDEAPGLSNEFRAEGIPLQILMYKGREVDRRMGLMPESVLQDWVRAVKVRTEEPAT